MTEETLFIEALEIGDPGERSAYLDRACAGDAALRDRLERLLDRHGKAGSFLARPPVAVSDTGSLVAAGESPTQTVPSEPDIVGTQIGPYKLLQQIGEGGMGTVYMAEQSQPVQRKVALKIIKPGMDTRLVIARFEAERQALAVMDHPNIAKVFDAGTTDSERPYFVMELVRGVPITKYCDEHRLTPRQRLELFLPVCQAIQHAHQKGIIHRDIKPSNILVAPYDGTPVVKVIDFGVAKATGQRLTDKTLFTEFGAVVGTLEYMSPEQAELNNQDIDTRSDIYSLGVLLYELLTGTTPMDRKQLKDAAFMEMLRMIREEVPPKPSTRLSDSSESLPSISAQRQTEPSKLTKLMRGELDWIVMKALEKDRNRRYETANGFAADVMRYLSDEAVHACPPTAGYRLRKFVQRNKRALTSAAVLALAALVVAGTLGWAVRDREARQEEAAKQEGARQAKLQEEVTRTLGEAKALYKEDRWPEALTAVKRAEGLLAAGPASAELQRSVEQSRADLEMVAGLEDIRVERASEPGGEFNAAANQAFGEAFRQYGLEVESLDPDETARRIGESVIKHHLIAALDDWLLAKRALSTRTTHSPARKKELAVAAQRLLTVVRRADSDPFRDRLREALQRGDTKSLSTLAFEENTRTQPLVSVLLLDSIVSETMGHHPGSWAAHRVLRQAQQLHPDDFWINHRVASQLISVRLDSDLIRLHNGGAAEAVGYCRAALALRPNSYGVRINQGIALTWTPRPAVTGSGRQLPEAEAEYRAAIRLQPTRAKGHSYLGVNLWRQRKWAEAETELQTAIRLKPTDSSDSFAGVYYGYLGDALVNQGKRAEADAAFREARRLMPNVYDYCIQKGNLMLRVLDVSDEAEGYFRVALGVRPGDAKAQSSLDTILDNRKLKEKKE